MHELLMPRSESAFFTRSLKLDWRVLRENVERISSVVVNHISSPWSVIATELATGLRDDDGVLVPHPVSARHVAWDYGPDGRDLVSVPAPRPSGKRARATGGARA